MFKRLMDKDKERLENPGPRIAVINVRTPQHEWPYKMSWYYVGRTMSRSVLYKYGSSLGNPFKGGGELQRHQNVVDYEKWLREKLEDKNCEQYKEMMKIFGWATDPGQSGICVGCWCAPKECHGDVIVKIIHEWWNAGIRHPDWEGQMERARERVKKYNTEEEEEVTEEIIQAITEFRGEYRWLSNFWASDVVYEGFRYPTLEHAYQAAKFHEVQWKKQILACIKPGDAKQLARALGRGEYEREDWRKVNISIMCALLLDKFTRNPELGKKLMYTAPAELVEGNNWHDNFWGNCVCSRCEEVEGKNWLGKLLMAVRDRLLKLR